MEKKFLVIIIIVLLVISINAIETQLLELSAGDIVNINNFGELSTETVGNVLDDYEAEEYAKTDYFTGEHYTSIKKKTCLSLGSLLSYAYPEINIDDTEQDPTKIFSSADKLRYNYFGISENYIHNEYLYGIVKICRVERTQNLIIRVIDDSDFPSIDNHMNYKLLLDETAVLRLKGKDGTHYITSITTGECLLQHLMKFYTLIYWTITLIKFEDEPNRSISLEVAYVNEAGKCNPADESQKKKKSDNFFESSFHRSRVIAASNRLNLENIVNDNLNNSGKSLFDLSNNPIAYPSILNLLIENAVIRIKLHSLPELPESLIRSVQNAMTHKIPLKYLKPGDVINAFDLKAINSPIAVDNILVDVLDEIIERSAMIYYTDCFAYIENGDVSLDHVTYREYPDYPPDTYYKFDIFDEIVKRKHYGIDHKYLNNKYKCMKITICSEFERRKLIIPSVYVISLGEQNIRHSNIFESTNIVLRYRKDEETHYVARTEKGNCLFQALVFPNDGQSREYNTPNLSPLYTGKIISATEDPVFEKRAKNYVRNLTAIPSNTLIGMVNNPEATYSFFSEFTFNNRNITLINIYLDNLH